MKSAGEEDLSRTPTVPSPPPASRSLRRAILTRGAFLLVTLITLYVLWPSLLKVFSAWPELLTINPVWFLVMLAFEIASFVCMWALQRLAMRTSSWFGVATSQLAGNAVSRLLPGGAAAGAAVQFRLLTQAGVATASVATALTVTSLVGTATLLALPILVIPTVLAGRPVPRGLAQAGWLGGAMFVVLFSVGATLLTTDRPLEAIGRAVQWLSNRLQRRRPQQSDVPARLVSQRDQIRETLGEKWWRALLAAAGNSLFDYLALLAALTAVGSRPRPSLVLLAYVAAMVLGMIPITPGGLGFVEAGLTGMLALAGVSGPDAVLSTLAYRLVSYWLPLPSGVVALLLHRHRYEHASPATGD